MLWLDAFATGRAGTIFLRPLLGNFFIFAIIAPLFFYWTPCMQMPMRFAEFSATLRPEPEFLETVPSLCCPLPIFLRRGPPPLWDGCSDRKIKLVVFHSYLGGPFPTDLLVKLHIKTNPAITETISNTIRPPDLTLSDLKYILIEHFKPTSNIYDVRAVMANDKKNLIWKASTL